MPVKVTIGSQEQLKETKGFPKVMKSKFSNLVVFFEKEKVGQVLISNQYYTYGYISKTWGMSNFEDFTEPITIQTV